MTMTQFTLNHRVTCISKSFDSFFALDFIKMKAAHKTKYIAPSHSPSSNHLRNRCQVKCKFLIKLENTIKERIFAFATCIVFHRVPASPFQNVMNAINAIYADMKRI